MTFTKKIKYLYIIPIVTLLIFHSSTIFSQTNNEYTPKNNTKIENKEKYWYLPDLVMMQTAGYIGYIAGGAGYTFFNEHLEIIACYGYVPEHIGGYDIHTLALKFNYNFYTLELNRAVEICPFYLGITTLFALDKDLYWEQSTDCPDHYYPPTGFHASVNMGLNLRLYKQHTFFTEICMLDTYAKAYFWDDHGHLAFNECVTLAFGYKLFF